MNCFYCCVEKLDKPGAWIPVCDVHLHSGIKQIDPVEEMISEFVNNLYRTCDPINQSSAWWHGRKSVEQALRDLVELARKK